MNTLYINSALSVFQKSLSSTIQDFMVIPCIVVKCVKFQRLKVPRLCVVNCQDLATFRNGGNVQ